MKYPALLSFNDINAQLDQFDTIIDVRSPSEFADDHIPGAINCPVLNDEERQRVGTLYKQVSAFDAKKMGAAMVSRHIAHHIDTHFNDKPRDWSPLIYCWRGGNRSGAMAYILARIGWPVIQLDGGYKDYRRFVNSYLLAMPAQFQFYVICGPTGSGKSRLLQKLTAQGAQVLDLEKLAAHRGSVLGSLPSVQQPSQKSFESSIWQTLRHFNPDRPVFVESESKKIGNLRVPDALMEKIRSSHCITLELSRANRVQLLLQDYAHFVTYPSTLISKLECLIPLQGKEKILQWQIMARSGEMACLFDALLVHHYDPAYSRSIARNFLSIDQAKKIVLEDISEGAFDTATLRIAELILS